MKSIFSRAPGALALLVGLAPTSAAQGPGSPVYELQVLPRPDGMSLTLPMAIADSGHVVAIYREDLYGGPSLPARHAPDGALEVLPGGPEVLGVDGSGVAVGGGLLGLPTAWPERGAPVSLSPPPGLLSGYATDISAGLHVCGRMKDGAGRWHGVLWIDRQPVTIPEQKGGSELYAIGDNGHAAGSTRNLQGEGSALYFDGRKSVFLDPFGKGGAILEAMNDVGQAAGRAPSDVPAFPNYTDGQQAFLYDHGTGATTGLGFLTEWGYFSQALGVNDAGAVVGFALRQPPNSAPVAAAFLWRSGAMLDLNDLTANLPDRANLVAAKGITDDGRILVAVDLAAPGHDRWAGVLTPVEPAAAE